eukprot:TRINITY_DN22021_c0_g1_i1.p1 TRINITY_DN22021_c0_g1~~TRINITY_DN22021_c0_g1_i1.p1  ORF type:complete len:932 (+),score=103.83 TRINITY_DN22021_c0_g1_i1:82-2877(+)
MGEMELPATSPCLATGRSSAAGPLLEVLRADADADADCFGATITDGRRSRSSRLRRSLSSDELFRTSPAGNAAAPSRSSRLRFRESSSSVFPHASQALTPETTRCSAVPSSRAFRTMLLAQESQSFDLPTTDAAVTARTTGGERTYALQLACELAATHRDDGSHVSVVHGTRDHRVALAAMYLHQVIRGTSAPLPTQSSCISPTQLKCFQLRYSPMCDWLRRLASFGLAHLGAVPCPPEGRLGRFAPLLALICSLILVLNLCLKRLAMGPSFWHHRTSEGRLRTWHVVQVVCLIAIAVDVVMQLIGMSHWCVVRGVLRAPRAFLLVAQRRQCRINAGLFLRTLPGTMPVLGVTALLVCLWAAIAYVLFDGMPNEGPDGPFDTIGHSLWSTIVLLSTANNPDVGIPAYRQNGFYFIFFASFQFLGCYVMLNLLYAQVYGSYLEGHKYHLRKLLFHHTGCLREAFRILKDPATNRIPADVMEDVLQVLGVTGWRFEVWTAIARNLHESGAGQLVDVDRSTFMLAYPSALSLALGALHPVRRPRNESARRLRATVAHGGVTSGARAYRAVHSLLIIWGLAAALASVGSTQAPWWLRPEGGGASPLASEAACCTIFLIDAALCMVALGPWSLWARTWHRLDLIFAVASTAGCCCLALAPPPASASTPHGVLGSWWSCRLVSTLRVLRVCRLLALCPDVLHAPLFRVLRLLPHTKDLFIVLAALYYIFIVIGEGLFAGQLNASDDRLANGDPYYNVTNPGNYYPLNFDTFTSSAVVLFHLMVVNNWFVIVEAYMRAVSPYAVIYFLAWYVLAALLFVNVITAFVAELVGRWDSFKSRRERNVAEVASDEEEDSQAVSSRTTAAVSRIGSTVAASRAPISSDPRIVMVGGKTYEAREIDSEFINQLALFRSDVDMVEAEQEAEALRHRNGSVDSLIA